MRGRSSLPGRGPRQPADYAEMAVELAEALARYRQARAELMRLLQLVADDAGRCGDVRMRHAAIIAALGGGQFGDAAEVALEYLKERCDRLAGTPPTEHDAT